MVLNFNDGDQPHYEIVRRMPLAAVISPQFVRIREDKQPVYEHVRIEQASERVEVRQSKKEASQLQLPKSEVIRRDVYTKEAKGKTMVRKFVTWKTNKHDEMEEFPAFVHHYTDFSPNRKAPLDRDVRISNSQSQIMELHHSMIEANIKKGWELVTTTVDGVTTMAEPPLEIQSPTDKTSKKTSAKKKATKKTTAKKKSAKKKTTKDAAPESNTRDVEAKATKKKATKKSAKKKAARKKKP